VNQFKLGAPLKKKITGQCPCGYCFETLRSENDAVTMVQVHVESFHKDFLPFGITSEEALTLLKIDHRKGNQKASTGTFYSTKTERARSSRNNSRGTREEVKGKRMHLAEQSFS
jgi:hypothetical protein